MSEQEDLVMIENTGNRSALDHIFGIATEGQSGYIEGMEAAGQRQLLASEALPADAPWSELEALGFTKTTPVAGDDLFVNCNLPEGWRREGSDHSMWSYIVDGRGIRRVGVFYKAAFYDRRASARIERPGAALATAAIYGDEPAALPDAWGLLADDERQDFRDSLTRYCEQAADCPQVYADRLPKVTKLVELSR